MCRGKKRGGRNLGSEKKAKRSSIWLGDCLGSGRKMGSESRGKKTYSHTPIIVERKSMTTGRAPGPEGRKRANLSHHTTGECESEGKKG